MTPLSPSDLDRLEAYAREPVVTDLDECPHSTQDFYINGKDELRCRECESARTVDADALLSLVAMARQAPRWIPVEEGLPPMQTAVYALSPRVYGLFTATWNGEHWAAVENELIDPVPPVTLWAPLPVPPEKE